MRKGADEDDEDEDTERSAPWLLTRWHGLAARMPTALPAVAVIAVGASLFLAAGAAPDWVTPPTKAETVQTALSESGYRTLKVARSADGRLTVTGLVATEKDRARLQRLLQARKFEVAVQVQTGERLALTVEDVFRANGLEAKARSTAPGVVRVEVRDAAEGEIASVQKLAVQEVPGLKHLGVDRIGGPPPEAAPEPKPLVISADPGKRVTSVVDGDLDYIATEDGSRYFAGAILPTGHRLLDVQDQIVSVEKDGAVSQLVF